MLAMIGVHAVHFPPPSTYNERMMKGATMVPFYGVDATTSRRAFEPMTLEDVAELAKQPPPQKGLAEQEARQQLVSTKDDKLGVTADVKNPDDLGQTGWAVVWGESVTTEVKAALEPLISHRQFLINATIRKQDKGKTLFRELKIKRNDDIDALRTSWKYSPGPISPAKVPAYVMLVGPPTDFSFDLQHQLDVDFFVGRLDLDSVAEYAAYAKAVVEAEMNPKRPRRAVFFGTKHPNDPATSLSLPNLVTPLAKHVEDSGLPVVRAFEDAATKTALAAALATDVPGLLFTGGHGALVQGHPPADRKLQRTIQGALITQEWPNDPNLFGPLDADHRFAASDLAGPLDGLISIFFACYGGGTPQKSRFRYSRDAGIFDLADEDFTAALPKGMLARGAGAVIAHVERAWDTGFSWEGIDEPQLDAWQSVLTGLLDGNRVGRAVAYLNERFSSIAADLSRRLTQEKDSGIVIPKDKRAYLWMQHEDARSWIVLGDPAAKLAMSPPKG